MKQAGQRLEAIKENNKVFFFTTEYEIIINWFAEQFKITLKVLSPTTTNRILIEMKRKKL